MTKQTGSCLCGKVTLSLDLNQYSLSACHCNMCRKWSAGPLMTIAHNGKITLTNKEIIKYYQSSQWAERVFCSECGTHLFYHLHGTDQYYIAAWIFDNLPELKFDQQVYIDKKPTCYDFANHTHNLTEADILAMIQNDQSSD